jgi:hypothetical protein
VSNLLLLSQAELATILNSSQAKVDQLERENAALRKALEDDRREWRKLALCLGVGQPVIVLGSAAIDAARAKEGAAP